MIFEPGEGEFHGAIIKVAEWNAPVPARGKKGSRFLLE